MSQPKENKMGTMPVNKLLLSMSLPIMISMLVQALYNVVDSVFVSQINEEALTAVSLAFPLQNLMIAVSTGTGVGVNALLSKSLGEKRFDTAQKTAHNAILLSILSSLLFVVIGLFLCRPYFNLMIGTENLAGQNLTQITEYGIAYLRIVSIVSFGLFGQIALERLLQSTGRTMFTMISQSTGAVINIILDPILIFGKFGLPKMGVAGAAAATVIGQIIAMILALIFNLTKNKEIHFSLRALRFDGKIIKKIYSVGLPSIIMASVSSVMTFVMNRILIAFTATATAVFGVYFKLQSFVLMPVFGMNNGMVPIVAYNYGARKRSRIFKTIKLSLIYVVSWMVLGFIAFQLLPDKLLLMFNASEHMLSIGVPALRIISSHFLIAGFCIISISVFQALGRGISSLIVSVSRQLVVLVPVAYLLAHYVGKLDAVWWAFPIAEAASFILCAIFLSKILKQLPEEEDQ